jgi:hypothetical protein
LLLDGWKGSDFISGVAAAISLAAMVVAILQARSARRQADAALGEVEPLVFLDIRPFENPQAIGGRASLTVSNHNRRDIRLTEIEIKTDGAIAVAVDNGNLRDVIAAAYKASRRPAGPVKIDLRERHYIVQGSSIGVAGSREVIPLNLTRIGDRPYANDTADLVIAVRYVLLDARHTEKRVEVSATVPFRLGKSILAPAFPPAPGSIHLPRPQALAKEPDAPGYDRLEQGDARIGHVAPPL